MKNIREIISENIIALRKKWGLTQVELAKKLNFSDKAVSRWEKGEVVPEVETIEKIANVFNVPITYMMREHTDYNSKRPVKSSEIVLALLSVCVIWCISTILFVYLELIDSLSFWQVFVWSVPASAIVILYFNKKWNRLSLRFIMRTILCWSLITSIYLQFLSYNLWLIYLIGIPIQITILVSYVAKKLPIITEPKQSKKQKQSEKEQEKEVE